MRAYAQAAVACGDQVVALDVFADEDTRRVAQKCLVFELENGDINGASFKRVFSHLDLRDITGFAYASGFDLQPDLLAWVAERVPLIGNAPQVMQGVKSFEFFEWLDDLNIAYPETQCHMPQVPLDWLSKQFGGTGGAHVQAAVHTKAGHYFQRKMAGIPISALFVADGKTANIIGINRQFVSPTVHHPYRFAGAVNGIALQPNIYADFEHAVQALTRALGLRGLNSLDAILDGEHVWILELNPRLSATFQLYDGIWKAHLAGCAGDPVEIAPITHANAMYIVYADAAISVPLEFAWPEWVADLPQAGVKIAAGAPVCTVLAQAADAESAQSLLFKRIEMIKENIKLWVQNQ